jgi:hypothetical protein
MFVYIYSESVKGFEETYNVADKTLCLNRALKIRAAWLEKNYSMSVLNRTLNRCIIWPDGTLSVYDIEELLWIIMRVFYE